MRASSLSVRAGRSVTFTGRVRGLAPGSRVLLQRRSGGKWTSLSASTTVLRGGGYRLTTALNTRGRQVLRVLDGTTASSPVTVTVR